MEIKRDFHLKKLIASRHNGMIKIVTGIRRCGKSYLLFKLFRDYLRNEGVRDDHISSSSQKMPLNVIRMKMALCL